ncbi:MAG TPA: SAM-dependent methyltransferase [Blastocatellia bacterium]|jgi:SAM-dependent MidA family methyltransferase|nr:SAM-dependent methyltransferase [Blastocatellia bacterium]
MSAHDAENAAPPLAGRLRERIRREGAVSFRDWMAAALYDAREGYYVRPDLVRWGRAGDYRTAPERSPLFAATFARYFAGLFGESHSPRECAITEAGAGAGSFARGVLGTLQRDHPTIFHATRYVIDEVSPSARERAREALKEFAGRVEFRSLAETALDVGEGIVFANELLDAFPVHRVRLRDGKLYEQFVELGEGQRFVFTEREPSTPRLREYFEGVGVELSEGQVAEVNLGVEEWVNRAASTLKRGHIIIVDYGAQARDLYAATHRQEGTLRAFHRHRLAQDPLDMMGEQDLTTTIDWTNVRRAGEKAGLTVESFDRQDEFLLRAGLLDQLERMATEATSDADALILRASVRELILPGGMSESFQVMVLKKE